MMNSHLIVTTLLKTEDAALDLTVLGEKLRAAMEPVLAECHIQFAGDRPVDVQTDLVGLVLKRPAQGEGAGPSLSFDGSIPPD